MSGEIAEVRGKYVRIEHASGRGVAERWRRQYASDGGWYQTASGDSGIVYDRLCALGPNPDIAAVAEVIGNKSWSYIACDSCGDDVERAVRLGEYDSKVYCLTCITEAARVFGK